MQTSKQELLTYIIHNLSNMEVGSLEGQTYIWERPWKQDLWKGPKTPFCDYLFAGIFFSEIAHPLIDIFNNRWRYSSQMLVIGQNSGSEPCDWLELNVTSLILYQSQEQVLVSELLSCQIFVTVLYISIIYKGLLLSYKLLDKNALKSHRGGKYLRQCYNK